MGRALLVIAILAALAAAGAGVGLTWLERSNKAAAARLDEREAYWADTVKAAVPLGADRDKVERWLETLPDAGQEEGQPLGYNADTHAYLVTPEAVPSGGFRFPCASRPIAVEVTMGADGTVIRREAHVSGSCV